MQQKLAEKERSALAKSPGPHLSQVILDCGPGGRGEWQMVLEV